MYLWETKGTDKRYLSKMWLISVSLVIACKSVTARDRRPPLGECSQYVKWTTRHEQSVSMNALRDVG